MRSVLTVTAAVAVLLVGASLSDGSPAPSAVSSDGRAAQDEAAQRPAAPPPAAAPTASPLLQPAAHGDGDSWRDTAGTEYRLGMVNAPEQDECFGAEATAERRRQVAAGFRAEAYTVDRYGRSVSVVTTADGRNLNVHLARQGFVDDRYLADFRHENRPLAAELDVAFAEARAQGRGLWSACAAAPAAPAAPGAAPAAAAGADCHPDYVTCITVVGDGSGNGGGNDLDCGDVTGAVQLRQPGVDPYRFDADEDGIGCDS
jgi:endonuclease YncB( thermonuclease family)